MDFALCSLLVIVLNKMRDKGIKMWRKITETLFVSKQNAAQMGEFTGHFLQMKEFYEVNDEKNVGNVKYYYWDCSNSKSCGTFVTD